ncbi:hypothetical protein PINS_up023573 [Pythium insidiosum]|nr:hypothetical protein PINS_up023573 [Pythium insidiosum]
MPTRRRLDIEQEKQSPAKRRLRSPSIASDAAPSTPPLYQLSTSLWKRILSFAVDRPVDAILPRPPRRPATLLAPFKGITGQADVIIRQLARRATKSCARLRVTGAKTFNRRDLDALRAAPERVRVLCVTPVAGKEPNVRASWLQLFASMPNLRRLDLSACRWSDAWLPVMLASASAKCPRVESLVLPGSRKSSVQAYDSDDDDGEMEEERTGMRQRADDSCDHFFPCHRNEKGSSMLTVPEQESSTSDTSDDEDDAIDEEEDDRETAAEQAEGVLPAVYDALQRWFQHGAIGGLRQVQMTCRPQDRSLTQNTRFLEAILTWCPNVQYLDGWKASFQVCSRHRVQCFDSMDVPIDVWTAFCDTCVHLREFNWVVVPFSDAFIHAFAKSPKRELRKLRVEFQCRPYEFPVMAGYQFSTSSLSHLLAAVPSLEQLVIRGSSTFQMHDMISDKLLLTLARRCPRLRKLRLLGCRRIAYKNVTDRGIMALARLPLRYLWFDNYVSCSKWSVLALIEHHATVCEAQRTVFLPVSCSEIMVDVLTSLVRSPFGHYAGARFVVEIQLEQAEELPSDWIKRHRFMLEQRHPTLTLKLALETSDSVSTVRVSKFVLYTRTAVLPSHTRQSILQMK